MAEGNSGTSRLTVEYLQTSFKRFWNPQLEYDMNSLSGQMQQLYKEFFYLWRLIMTVIVVNIVACLIYLCYEGAVGTFLFSFVLVLLIPLYYYTWYNSLNKALQTNSSLSFVWFFITFGFQTLFSIFWAAGWFPGAVGWYQFVAYFHNGWIYSILMLIASILFTVYALASVYLIMTVHQLYRASGASISQARTEAAAAAPTPAFTVTVQPAPRY